MEMTKQPEALRLADELERWLHVQAKDRIGAAAELRRLQAENEALRAEYQSACGVVARMHLAATGQTIGPKRGVVEDVEDLRAEVEELRSRLQTTLSSGESHEDSLKSRDEALLRQALEALVWSNEYLETLSEKLFPKSKKPQAGSTTWHVHKAIAALRKRLNQSTN